MSDASSQSSAASAPSATASVESAARAVARELAEGRRPDGGNTIVGLVESPRAGEILALPPLGSPERTRLAALGERALADGEVGVVVLAGGMATRFGGVVKALVPVAGDATFLDLKLADVLALRKRLGARIPFYCLTSFATHDAVAAALASAEDTRAFQQFDSVRLAEDGTPFIDGAGAPSRYATGHGDLTFALRSSGILAAFRAAGGKTLLMSNVDNLTATLDPAIIGMHVEAARAITVEVAKKAPGDKGGAPARVDGVLQIVEGFRFPPTFDQDSIPVFNTNTLVLDAAAIDRDVTLTWFAVAKKVDGRTAWQLERLVGELTAFLPSTFIRVEREGPDARFQPVKEVEDLGRQAPLILDVLRGRGVPV